MTTRLKQLENERKMLEDMYKQIGRFVLPRYADIDGTDQTGTQYGLEMFDTTAATALSLRSNALVGYMMSPGAEWFRIMTENSDLMRDKELGEYLQYVEAGVYSALARSNFYDAMQVAFEIGDGFGTACVWSEEDEENKRIIFTPIDPGQAFISYDKYGNVDTFFRRYKLPVRVLKQQFGELPRSMEAYAKGAEPYKLITCYQGILPRKELEDTLKEKLKFDREKKWASIWMTDTDILGEPQGFYDFPISVWRPERIGNESYGRCVTMRALPTIRSVNKIAKDLLKASEQAVKPSIQAPASMKGRVSVLPGKINYYQSPNEKIEPIQYGNYPIGVEELNLMQQEVRDMYQIDAFLLLSSGVGEGAKTATEIMELRSEKAAVIGPMIGRLQADFMDANLNRVVNLEMRAFRIKPPSARVAQLLDSEGGSLNIDYLGPLSMAQKTLHETMGNRRAIEAVAPIFSIAPSVADRFDWDNLTEHTAIANGIKREFLRDDKEVQEIRDKRQAEAAMQQATANAESMAKTAETVAKTQAIANKAGAQIPGMGA